MRHPTEKVKLRSCVVLAADTMPAQLRTLIAQLRANIGLGFFSGYARASIGK